MVSVATQTLNVRKFADIDNALWKAFTKAEKNEPIPFFALGRFRHTYPILLKNKKIDWRGNYWAAFISTSVFALLCIVGKPMGMPWQAMLGSLILYCVSLVWMYWAKATFNRKYSEFELKHTEIAEHAFGLHGVALLVKRVVDTVPLPQGKERKVCLDALIKINKAAQDHGEVNFGIVDVFKKAAITGVLSAISWLVANGEKIKEASDGVAKSVSSPWIFYPMVGLLTVSILFLFYDIVIGQPRLKKKKKRYLLMLNIIRETSND